MADLTCPVCHSKVHWGAVVCPVCGSTLDWEERDESDPDAYLMPPGYGWDEEDEAPTGFLSRRAYLVSAMLVGGLLIVIGLAAGGQALIFLVVGAVLAAAGLWSLLRQN